MNLIVLLFLNFITDQHSSDRYFDSKNSLKVEKTSLGIEKIPKSKLQLENFISIF